MIDKSLPKQTYSCATESQQQGGKIIFNYSVVILYQFRSQLYSMPKTLQSKAIIIVCVLCSYFSHHILTVVGLYIKNATNANTVEVLVT